MSKLLVNELSKTMIREIADEIVTRQEQQNLGGQTENIRDLNLEPNYHVSKFCEVCKSSAENETPPILAEILFENSKVIFPVKFTYCGDGAELVDISWYQQRILLQMGATINRLNKRKRTKI